MKWKFCICICVQFVCNIYNVYTSTILDLMWGRKHMKHELVHVKSFHCRFTIPLGACNVTPRKYTFSHMSMIVSTLLSNKTHVHVHQTISFDDFSKYFFFLHFYHLFFWGLHPFLAFGVQKKKTVENNSQKQNTY